MLTLGQLLNLIERFDAGSFAELAQSVRNITPDVWEAASESLSEPTSLRTAIVSMAKPYPSSWPFQDWLRLAVTRFGLTPNQFWDTSVRDWLVIIEPEKSTGLSLSDLQTLMDRFPDKEDKSNG